MFSTEKSVITVSYVSLNCSQLVRVENGSIDVIVVVRV